MGNAHTHDRRKSGAPETGLTIEGIREKPLPQHERKQGRVEKKVWKEVYDTICSKFSFSFYLTGVATQLPYIRGRNKRGSGNWKYSRRNPAITQTITGQGGNKFAMQSHPFIDEENLCLKISFSVAD